MSADNVTALYTMFSTPVTFTSHTAWYPDAGPPGPPGVDFHIVIANRAVAVLAPGANATITIETAEWARLVELAEAAAQQRGGELGVDTATGRSFSHVEVRVDRHHLDDEVRCVYGVNHYGRKGEGPAEWWTFIDAVLTVVDESLADDSRTHLQFVRDRFAEPTT